MSDWKKTLLQPNVSIKDAILAIDKGSFQIVLIVDKSNRLLGTVTDGDIRRGILKGIPFDAPVEKVMKKSPIALNKTSDRNVILNLMRQKKIHQLPLVDENNVVVGLEILDELLQGPVRDQIVVLMAGGMGSRLKPLTNDCPKPLLHVGNKPILEIILQNFIEYNFHEFYISVHYRDEMIRNYFGDGSKWGVKIQYLYEKEPYGTAGALSSLPVQPTSPLIVMNGDLLTKINFQYLLQFHSEHASEATMCVREYDFQVPYGVVQIENHAICGIDEKPVHRFFVNAGIYVLNPDVLKVIPKDTYFDMPELFKRLVAGKRTTAAFPIREYWLDIARVEDLARANGEFAGLFSEIK